MSTSAAVVPSWVAHSVNLTDGTLTIHCSDGAEVLLHNPIPTLEAILAHLKNPKPLGASIIDIQHPDMDVQVVVTPDITLEEAAQAMRQLQSPTSVTMPLAIPQSVKTVGDFFGEGMAESIANQLADQIYGVDCSRCGEPTKKPVEVGARKLCAPCAALEY